MTRYRPMTRVPDDWHPLTSDEDHRAILAEQLARDKMLTDLPDTLTDEEVEALREEWVKWKP